MPLGSGLTAGGHGVVERESESHHLAHAAMRRRLVAAFLALDSFCALAAPLVAPSLSFEPRPETTYVEIAGVCVEETGDADLGGQPVEMSLCMGA